MDKPGIPPGDLIDRRIYRVRSRNLVIGAWCAAQKGFIGIREKFNTRYLFTEYEYTLTGAPFGTAWAMDDLGVDVPTDVQMVEYLPDPDGTLRTNAPLLALLKEYEPRAVDLRDQENERFDREAREREAALTPEEKAEREEKVREWIASIQAKSEVMRAAERLDAHLRWLAEGPDSGDPPYYSPYYSRDATYQEDLRLVLGAARRVATSERPDA